MTSHVNYDAVLFENGEPSYLLLSEWRNRDPATPLSVAMQALNADRTPSDLFRSAWRGAFPDRAPLPNEPIAEPDGRGTQAFWDALR